MSRCQATINDPQDLKQMADAITELQQIVDAKIEFGNPQDPAGQGTTLAGAGTPTTHNGQTMNILGRWVELSVDALDAAVTVNHNLNVPVFSSGGVNQLNVRWIPMGLRHTGAGVNAASTISYNYDTRDQANITTNSFQIRVYAGGTRTVNNVADQIKISMLVIPANRWA